MYLASFLLVFLVVPSLAIWTWDKVSPLDTYVNRPDPSYSYEVIGEGKYQGYTLYQVNFTSQTWKDERFSNHKVWWHFLSIVVPDNLIYRNASFLYIGGGSSRPTSTPPVPARDKTLRQLVRLAMGGNVIAAYLRFVPNQPVTYMHNPSRERYEDDAIALTWRMYLEDQSDPEVLMRMPMTKAAMKAMDTITDVGRRRVGGGSFDKFMVAGASKRGWTTWTTGAVDRRVIAIAPIVLSILNMQPNLKHHFRSLGGWTWVFGDYYRENLTLYLDSPMMKNLTDVVDPYSYKERLTMPKLIISGSSDEFFLPDDSHYFFSDLRGPKYMWLVENTGHSISNSPRFNDVWDDMQAFFISAITGFKLPLLGWTRHETPRDGTITMITDTQPSTIVGFSATTTDAIRRDFRFVRGQPPTPNPIVWTEFVVENLGGLTYRAQIQKPASGWRAFFIKATFPGPGSRVLTFTSEVHIIPDTFPFPTCHGTGCRGTLV